MYTSAFHKELGILVGYFSGTDDTDQDYQGNANDILLLDRECQDNPYGTALIICTSAETPRPNANRRRIVADANNQTKAHRSLVAVVAPSVLVRGVVTLINWLSHVPNQETSTHSTFEEAVRWMEEKQGRKLPEFFQLLEEAKKKQQARRASNA